MQPGSGLALPAREQPPQQALPASDPSQPSPPLLLDHLVLAALCASVWHQSGRLLPLRSPALTSRAL
jgi:hypothetical protein